MGVLSLAVIASLAVVKRQADVSTMESHGRKARALAEKGVALASHPNINNGDPLLDFQDAEYEEGYRAETSSLSQTFGINVLAEQVRALLASDQAPLSSHFLYQLLTAEWGLDDADAQVFLHSMAEWIDPDDQVSTISGWERLNYERDGFSGRPYNRFFKSLDEVELVHGYQALKEAKPNWQDYFNIWTQGKIDLSSASAETISLASITEFGRKIDEAGAGIIKERILGPDGILGTDDDMPNPNVNQLLTENSIGDVSDIVDRYIIEGEWPQYTKLISKGWSGSVQISIILTLQTQSNSPTILERTERLEEITHE